MYFRKQELHKRTFDAGFFESQKEDEVAPKMEELYLELDAVILKNTAKQKEEKEKEKYRSGSTCVSVVINKERTIVSHVGDSRLV